MLCCVGVATLPSVGWLCLIRRSETCYCCYCMLCRCSHPPFGRLAVSDKMKNTCYCYCYCCYGMLHTCSSTTCTAICHTWYAGTGSCRGLMDSSRDRKNRNVCFLVTWRNSRLFSFLFSSYGVYYGKNKRTNLLSRRVARKHDCVLFLGLLYLSWERISSRANKKAKLRTTQEGIYSNLNNKLQLQKEGAYRKKGILQVGHPTIPTQPGTV